MDDQSISEHLFGVLDSDIPQQDQVYERKPLADWSCSRNASTVNY
jgi:hypothetical protein